MISADQIREIVAEANRYAPTPVPIEYDCSDLVCFPLETNVESYGSHPRALRARLAPLARAVGWTEDEIDGAVEAWRDMGDPSHRIVTVDGCGVVLEGDEPEWSDTGVRHARGRWHIGRDRGAIFVDHERSVYGVGPTGGAS